MVTIEDHNNEAVAHGRKTINGVRLHYVIAGAGDPLVLLHGVPKTSYYWHKVIPLLSEHYTVIAPDLRGFGDSERPENGYDMETMGEDVAQLVSALGYEEFNLHGEDWGAAFAYALAASHPDRVKNLSFAEMLLPGQGLEEWSNINSENLHGDHPWLWHINFFHLQDYPEMLIRGREREFWSAWMKDECYNPNAISDEAVDEWVRCTTAPGGLRAIFEVYRATFENIELVEDWKSEKLDIPVLTVGSKAFIDEEVERQMEKTTDVNRSVIFEECGHSLALEAPERLAGELHEFMN